MDKTATRKELLRRLIRADLSLAQVPVSLWACLQLSDPQILQAHVEYYELAPMPYIMPYHYLRNPEFLRDIKEAISRWSQRFRERGSEGYEQSLFQSLTTATTSTATPCGNSPLTSTPTPTGKKAKCPLKRKRSNADLAVISSQDPEQSENAKKLVKKRDNFNCVLSGTCLYDVAHIFPFSMLRGWDDLDRYWGILAMFWDDKKVKEWRQAALGSGAAPADLCQNLLCLSPTLHRAWDLGLFAFRPVHLSPDKKILRMEFHFLNHRSDKAKLVDLLTDPPAITDHTITTHSDYRLSVYSEHSHSILHSGDVIEISTSDPQNMPLPSIEILSMQWILQRILALTAAAELGNEDENESRDGDGDFDVVDDEGSSANGSYASPLPPRD